MTDDQAKRFAKRMEDYWKMINRTSVSDDDEELNKCWKARLGGMESALNILGVTYHYRYDGESDSIKVTVNGIASE